MTIDVCSPALRAPGGATEDDTGNAPDNGNATSESAGAGGRAPHWDDASLRRRVAAFSRPVLRKSVGQMLTSIGGFVAACAAMYLLAGISYWLALALAPLAAGFLVRTFIVQHDCGHGTFFRSRRLNDAVGILCSVITLTPYHAWHRQHAGHHTVWNNLDRRDTGADMYSACLTVEEYRALPPLRRLWYRFTRNVIFANLLLPPFVFLVLYRVPFDMPAGWQRERMAVVLTNLMLVAAYGGLALLVGLELVLAIQLPVLVLSSIAGVWLFTVQHRSERILWARAGDWSAIRASLQGATFLRLSPVLQWFSGNIGYHHVHHLNPKIPNYRLAACHRAVPELQAVPTMGFLGACRGMVRSLWDEKRQRMVTCREANA